MSTSNNDNHNDFSMSPTTTEIHNVVNPTNDGDAVPLRYLNSHLPSPATVEPLMDGTASVGSSAKYARENHVHPTDTSRASSTHTHGNITNAGDITSNVTIANGDRLVINDESASKITNSSITFGTSTNQYLANNGTWQSVPTQVNPATVAPVMDGTAAVGTSVKYAREDHVHPTDTSRQATLVSGTNIKTINNESLLGSGNIILATQDYVNNLITGTYSYTTTITPNGTTSSYTINHNLNTYNTIVSVGLFTGGTADSGTLETVPQGVFTSNNSLIYTVKQTSKNTSVLTFNKNVPSGSPLRVNIIAAESYVNLSNAVTKSYVDSIVADLTDINAIIQ